MLPCGITVTCVAVSTHTDLSLIVPTLELIFGLIFFLVSSLFFAFCLLISHLLAVRCAALELKSVIRSLVVAVPLCCMPTTMGSIRITNRIQALI